MVAPRALIIPFGVPTEARGLGLGLAALVHSFTHIEGQSVALAQLMARPREDQDAAPDGPVEAFVPPNAWRDLISGGQAPPDVAVVVTGAFEPPAAGKGMFQLLAFDAKDGATRARVEAHVDGSRAGETILGVLNEVWDKVGGELGLVRGIGDLGWEALESVLRAERCVLHDPLRNGPHDRLAAMLHLGRAVGDAPEARFPAGRLASVALETAMTPSFDAKLAGAALRALTRAAEDAPMQIDLAEATAALHVRLGNSAEAVARAKWAISKAPDRGRLYAILAEALRLQGDLDAALAAIDAGLRSVEDDGLLATERGVVLAQRGDVAGAELAWKRVLQHGRIHTTAFVNLAGIAATRKELPLAQALVDQALSARGAPPEVLRRAIQLAVATEPDGVARAARIGNLAESLLSVVAGDVWGLLVLAQARVRMGETAAALEGFARVVSLAPDSALAAEAQRERLAVLDAQASLEIEATLRAAQHAPEDALEGLAARGRSLTLQHGVWTAAFAWGVAEKRRGRSVAAREAFEQALSLAPGATPAHVELAELCASTGSPEIALRHAERVVELEGKSARAIVSLATALTAVGRHDEAAELARAGLLMDPAEPRLLALVAESGRRSRPPSLWGSLRDKLRKNR